MSNIKYPLLHNKRWLKKKLQNTPIRKLAKEIGCHHSTISHVIRKFDIKVPYRKIHIYDEGHTVWNKGKHPEYMQGKNHHNWRGGKSKIGKGYIYVWKPNHPFATKRGYVMEHRLVMEKYLGRYLKLGEVIHHRNEIKDDNRLENLELCKSNGENTKKHFNMATELAILKGKLTKYEAKFGKL